MSGDGAVWPRVWRFVRRTFFTLIILAVGVATTSGAQNPTVRHRPLIGVAFGGGSAKGFAHVGVIRWFEEHHIPIDRIAGTSIGGLVGGAYAAGMSSAELMTLLETTDWTETFGSSSFRYRNVRRKQDVRAYPQRLEFGFRQGIVPPPSINNGQQVDLLLARVAGAYLPLKSFDELPTPFRCVAVDLVTARAIVLDHGVLAEAMRATMSLPGVFPPVEDEGRVLVDGGAMNNVPADVVRSMGADVVIAIPVGNNSDTRSVDYSLHALPDQTVGALMRANTRAALVSADIVINPARRFGSLDWRLSAELITDGYAAADRMKSKLLRLAIDDRSWAAYLAERSARRRSLNVTPEFVLITGAYLADRAHMNRSLNPLVGRRLDVTELEGVIRSFAGLDRYETVRWRLIERDGRIGLDIDARQKGYAPPYFMLGVSLENIATDEFSFQLATRYLAFDVAGPESELRLDVAVGSRPNLGAELFQPLHGGPLFLAATGLAARRTLDFVQNGDILAQYDERRAGLAADVGLDVSDDDELRVGVGIDYARTLLQVGDPFFPDLRGVETRAHLRWLHDGQDSPVVPSGGARVIGTAIHNFSSPSPPDDFPTTRSNSGLTQAELNASMFWSRQSVNRIFVVGAAGTSFQGEPLANEQFQLGRPFRLGAYDLGELRADDYVVASAGYLRQIGRLPDFIGGPAFFGGWLEAGSVFAHDESTRTRVNASLGAIVSTLVGPAVIGASFGFDGHRRYYIGIGRLF